MAPRETGNDVSPAGKTGNATNPKNQTQGNGAMSCCRFSNDDFKCDFIHTGERAVNKGWPETNWGADPLEEDEARTQ